MQQSTWSRRLGVLAPGLAMLVTLMAAAPVRAEPRQPTPLPCTSIGGGKHQCYFYPAGDGISAGAPVQAHSGARVGYLNQGYNWVICSAIGSSVKSGAYTNYWWAWTEANNDRWGWVSALYGRGGENNGDFGGVPPCPTSVGYPPGGGPAPAPRPTPTPTSSAVPCSPIGAGRYSCGWYVPGDGTSGGSPVLSAHGASVGFLHKGSNWIVCQQAGIERTYAGHHNKWYGWTEADNGSSGWANAVYASGGADDGHFASAPACNGSHGSPPSSGTAPRPPHPTSGGSACPDATGPGDNVTRWNPLIICVLRLIGQPTTADHIHDVDIVIAGESSGNPGAINLTDSNARAGHPSEGLAQVIIGTFNANKCAGLPDNIWDPAANVCAGMRYAIRTYGSIANVPGVIAVKNGDPYIGYFAHLRGTLKGCGEIRAKRARLGVSARHLACRRARVVAKTIDASRALRRAARRAHPSRHALRVRTRYGTFRCQVEHGRSLGAALRAVACASRSKHVSWTALKG